MKVGVGDCAHALVHSLALGSVTSEKLFQGGFFSQDPGGTSSPVH